MLALPLQKFVRCEQSGMEIKQHGPCQGDLQQTATLLKDGSAFMTCNNASEREAHDQLASITSCTTGDFNSGEIHNALPLCLLNHSQSTVGSMEFAVPPAPLNHSTGEDFSKAAAMLERVKEGMTQLLAEYTWPWYEKNKQLLRSLYNVHLVNDINIFAKQQGENRGE